MSIVASVYNCENYISEMIESIINQTYQDWEMILIDDASTDNTWNIIQSYEDERIIKIRNQRNVGLTINLNKAISLCKGKYIVRIDADDIASTNRIALQVDYMENHPDVVLSGGYIRAFGETNCVYRNAIENDILRINLIFNSVVYHPTFIMRKESLCLHKINYDIKLKFAQDYNLIYELSKIGKIANIPEVLTYYRVHHRQISIEKKEEQKKCADYTRKYILRDLDVILSDLELEYWSRFCLLDYHVLEDREKEVIFKIKEKIILNNDMKRIYPKELISSILDSRIKCYFDNCNSEMQNNKEELLKDKFFSLFKLMSQWVKIKQQGKSVIEYFKRRNISQIAIYGLSDVGETLIEELKGSSVEVVYGIDRRANNIFLDLQIFNPNDNLEEVDMIVVTAITYFHEIEKELITKIKCPIVSLQEIMNEVEMNNKTKY